MSSCIPRVGFPAPFPMSFTKTTNSSGGTTNSEHGVANVEAFYDTFASMEKHDMVLNLHGEVLEAMAPEGMTLEEAFLPTLKKLHDRFPNLRIVVRSL